MMRPRLLVSFLFIAACSWFAGRPPISGQQPALAPLKPGMARIVFTRGFGILGAAVTHTVVDRGDSLVYNAMLIQRQTFPPERMEKGNFAKSWNVAQLYEISGPAARLRIGQPRPGDVPAPELAFMWGKEFYAHISRIFLAAGMVPNVRLECELNNGQTVTWDRPEGTTRFEVITEGGDQVFAPPYPVSAGKTYKVDYSYRGHKFKFTEVK